MATAFSQAPPHQEWSEASPSIDVPVFSGYNIFNVEGSTNGFKLVLTKHVPEQLLTRYIHAALKNALPKLLEDQSWFAEIPSFNGVWACGENPHECLNELREVLVDWLLLKIEHADRDIPIMDEINLNMIQ